MARFSWLIFLELIPLFVLLPLGIWWASEAGYRPGLPALLLVAGYCAWQLSHNPRFMRGEFVNPRGIRGELPGILLRWAAGGLLLAACIRVGAPESFFAFPRERPGLWLLVMALYPFLSVYPQELMYRTFLWHRYRSLHGESRSGFLLLSSVLYSFVHVVYGNWLAIFMTFAGGLLFARTYWRTRSLIAVWIEHSLWGNLIFTLGLGPYFYQGPVG